MIKGCQKNIIFLKDTGNELFDEAYFVVKPTKTHKEKDIVLEASKLVNNICNDKCNEKKSRHLLPFLIGLFVGFGATLTLCLFII